MERAIATNHKLDEALGLLLSLPKDIGDRDT
jgi:topoisomerase IA-like protein